MKEGQTKHVASSKAQLFWAVLLALSVLLVAEIGDYDTSVFWAACTLLLFGFSFWLRFREFTKKTRDLLAQGQSLQPYDYRKQYRNLIYLILLTGASFLAPFFLAGALGVALWFGSLIGIIDGWILQLLVYNVYLLLWERRNKGKLYVVQVWSGSRVTHTGLSFEREGNRK